VHREKEVRAGKRGRHVDDWDYTQGLKGGIRVSIVD
jgi:hypothetical protein